MEGLKMSQEARNGRPVVSLAVEEKMRELAELITRERFGPEGVPQDITFSEIEAIGHQAGRVFAAQVDRELMTDHGKRFGDEHPCPQCGRRCSSQPFARTLKTRDGTMELPETVCHCPDCRRSFFPSAGSVET
jgi:hypothetical protein